MARMSKFLVIFLLGLGLSGCATYYNIKVNGYTAPKTAEQLKPGGFFYIMEDKEAKNPLLETEVREKIVRLLEGMAIPSLLLSIKPIITCFSSTAWASRRALA